MENTVLFNEYYRNWIDVYKQGAVREITLNKYHMTSLWVDRLAPDMKICDLNRLTYQKLINAYAELHERQTTMDFHHQLKGAILDAVDEGYLDKDPTRKVIIKGRQPRPKKEKYLNQFQLQTLITSLKLESEISWEWFILLVAKTGMRFSEALALTPQDFDFRKQTLSVSKTWDYKGKGGFLPTKNKSSIRKIPLDWQVSIQFAQLLKDLPPDKPVFVRKKVYNSTVNHVLGRYCRKCELPVITIHGLRHPYVKPTTKKLQLFLRISGQPHSCP